MAICRLPGPLAGHEDRGTAALIPGLLQDFLGHLQMVDVHALGSGVERAATLRLALRDKGQRMPLNDSWIAATAIADELAVASQDSDYDEVPGLPVIRV